MSWLRESTMRILSHLPTWAMWRRGEILCSPSSIRRTWWPRMLTPWKKLRCPLRRAVLRRCRLRTKSSCSSWCRTQIRGWYLWLRLWQSWCRRGVASTWLPWAIHSCLSYTTRSPWYSWWDRDPTSAVRTASGIWLSAQTALSTSLLLRGRWLVVCGT